MKFSIITVSYNAEATIRKTIESVLVQQGIELEYLVIDGKSTDGTVAIIREYENRIAAWVSEPDKGIYDAMNKGIGMATGDIIGIINADDVFATPLYLCDVAAVFEKTGADLVYSNLTYVKGENQKPVRHWHAGSYKAGDFRLGWMPPHPTVMVRRNVYEKAGAFNLSFKISADYEFLLRSIEKFGFKPAYLNKTGVLMQVGGISNSNLRNRMLANREDALAWQINGLRRPLLLRYLKPARKLLQYLFPAFRS